MMTLDELRNTKYAEHMEAHKAHQTLIASIGTEDSEALQDEIKYSLDQLATTLEAYFKVIGIP